MAGVKGFARSPNINHTQTVQGRLKTTQVEVTIDRVHLIADDIVEITFAAQNGTRLQPWQPVSHIDIPVGILGYRQDSLSGDPKEPSCTISIL